MRHFFYLLVVAEAWQGRRKEESEMFPRFLARKTWYMVLLLASRKVTNLKGTDRVIEKFKRSIESNMLVRP